MLRNGMTDRIQNFAIRHSHAVGVHTKGAGTGYDFIAAGEAVGQTVPVARRRHGQQHRHQGRRHHHPCWRRREQSMSSTPA